MQGHPDESSVRNIFEGSFTGEGTGAGKSIFEGGYTFTDSESRKNTDSTYSELQGVIGEKIQGAVRSEEGRA